MPQMRFCSTLIAACLLASCATAAPEGPVKERTLTLQPQQTAALGNATLRFEQIEDSRCPPNVQCVTAGKISYRFSLDSGKGPEVFSLDAAAPEHASAGVRVVLQEATPPAVAAAGTPPQAHPVTLRVSHP